MIWYEEDVKGAELQRGKLAYEPETIFYGSSSIRLWNTLYEDFKEYRPINLGFGGSTLAACDWFFDRLLKPFNPKHIVFYAGDNDLGDGRSPEEVFIFFEQFVCSLQRDFPGVPFSFISIKPSIARWDIIDSIRTTNQLIKTYIKNNSSYYYYVNIFDSMLTPEGMPVQDLFDTDGLHLSVKGYDVWKSILQKHLATILKDSII
ncbi:GDSL-type esterase/lipase family protein [Ferruginibacter albus]|uniref:GDSL-type esterase/lipase family protein n=1 Tax=Ferruginibacter albus TaxID=2875540 RepID=UPI001CC5481C|nr:GDSL-type esterase/lipase family protein [Ferruginibacter albus]UAY52722.1 GDSL family lipase [Ferruginibacter albus]